MNYYVYRGGQHVRSFDTQAKADQWVNDQIHLLRVNGAKGHPEFKAGYNALDSKMTVWPQAEFKTQYK